MRPAKIKIFGLSLVLIALGLFTVANAGVTTDSLSQQPLSTDFYAILSFETFEGEGCGCIQISDVFINASGLTTDHNVRNITDTQGLCNLELEYDQTYRISIEHKDFTKVLMDLTVIGDQDMAFHMQEVEEESLQSHELVIEGKTIDSTYRYIR